MKYQNTVYSIKFSGRGRVSRFQTKLDRRLKKDKMHTVEIKLSHVASLNQHPVANCVEMTDGSSWYHRTRMNTS